MDWNCFIRVVLDPFPDLPQLTVTIGEGQGGVECINAPLLKPYECPTSIGLWQLNFSLHYLPEESVKNKYGVLRSITRPTRLPLDSIIRTKSILSDIPPKRENTISLSRG